jgi:hypothetical protein
MKLIYHKLENGSEDPIEIDFTQMRDLIKHIDEWSNGASFDRVYLATFSDPEDEGSTEIIVTTDKVVVFDLVKSMEDINWSDAFYLQEYSSFQEAYEVAFYIREGHPLAYPSTND